VRRSGRNQCDPSEEDERGGFQGRRGLLPDGPMEEKKSDIVVISVATYRE